MNTTVDTQARTELYKQAEKLIIEEGGVIIPLFMHMIAAIKNNCHGYVHHGRVGRFDLRAATCDR